MSDNTKVCLKRFYYISWLVRALRLVIIPGRILQYGPLNLKLFFGGPTSFPGRFSLAPPKPGKSALGTSLSTGKMSSEGSFEIYVKGLYADGGKRSETLQDEENLPNFHVDSVKLFEGTEPELEHDEPESSQELYNFMATQKSASTVKTTNCEWKKFEKFYEEQRNGSPHQKPLLMTSPSIQKWLWPGLKAMQKNRFVKCLKPVHYFFLFPQNNWSLLTPSGH